MLILHALAIVAALLVAFGFVMSAWRRLHTAPNTISQVQHHGA